MSNNALIAIRKLFPWLLLVIAIIVGSRLLHMLYYGENIQLQALGDVKVFSISNSYNSERVVATLKAGQFLDVVGCESTKSDIEVHVQLENNAEGAITVGKYQLIREHVKIKTFFFKPIVTSCNGMLLVADWHFPNLLCPCRPPFCFML